MKNMKKIYLILSLISLTATASAQHLVVDKTGGDNEIMQIADLKQITFDGTTVNIEQNDGTVSSASMGSIGRIYFGDFSSIDEAALQGDRLVEYLSANEIAVNCTAGSTVTIYSLTGTQMIKERTNAQGATIGIAGLPQGIYIIRANDRTAKIIKR